MRDYITWLIIYVISFTVIEVIATEILKMDVGLVINIIIVIISWAIASLSKRLFKRYKMQRKVK
ncbi:MAG: hypothetical protein ACRCWG_06105 [Sarcina sp.]